MALSYNRTIGRSAGATVLGVGCGTGNNWPLLLPIVGASGQVIGVDYSAGMLEQARRRADKAGWSNISLIEDDAAKLAHLDGPVDAFVSASCLGIVHDIPTALTRIVELVKPGGRIVILDFAQSRPDHRFFQWMFPLYRCALVAAGIDSSEGMDDARLKARWETGKATLRTLLPYLVEERFFHNSGVILHGARPARSDSSASKAPR
jgi:ubiquinone/menaquinone biosynthesis C-methylase UbiE